MLHDLTTDTREGYGADKYIGKYTFSFIIITILS